MTRLLGILIALFVGGVLLVAATNAPSAGSTAAAAAARPKSVFYGHIKSLLRSGRNFRLRFDPAWWLTGTAAQHAALEDTGSRDVPNDYYIVDEGHRLLTFGVRADAYVTVLTDAGGIRGTRVSVAELAQIVAGKNPRHRRLMEPKAGFWITIGERYPNPAVSLEQQYQP